MKAVAGIIFVILLASGGCSTQKQDDTQLENVIGYLSGNTRERIDEQSRKLSDHVASAKACAEKSQSPQLHEHTLHLEELAGIRDSAHTRLTHLEALAKDQPKCEAAYVDYKQWITTRRSIFKNIPDDHWNVLFNPVLGLDKNLLPESMISAKGMNGIQVSAIILEDALSTMIMREAETTLNNFDGCN